MGGGACGWQVGRWAAGPLLELLPLYLPACAAPDQPPLPHPCLPKDRSPAPPCPFHTCPFPLPLISSPQPSPACLPCPLSAPLQVKEDLKTVALGTSKINYLDPRITVAW